MPFDEYYTKKKRDYQFQKYFLTFFPLKISSKDVALNPSATPSSQVLARCSETLEEILVPTSGMNPGVSGFPAPTPKANRRECCMVSVGVAIRFIERVRALQINSGIRAMIMNAKFRGTRDVKKKYLTILGSGK